MVVGLAACGHGASPTHGPDAGRDAAIADAPEVDAPEVIERCDAPPTFADGLVPNRALHVEAGAAAGGDGSIAAPFAEIEQAAAVATPGTSIILGPGVHAANQLVSDLHGTALAPIWIGGQHGQPVPVIEAGSEGLHLARPRYVVIHDLELRAQDARGVVLDDGGDFADDTAAHHVALVGVHVHDVGTTGSRDCITVSGVSDLFVYDSRIERCGGAGSGAGIDLVGCHRSIVARNVFDQISASAVQARGGATDVDVRQNRIRDGGARAVSLGGSTDLAVFRPPLSASAASAEARRIRVFDNIITGTESAAFVFSGCVDCLVAHNAVKGAPLRLIEILQETATQAGFTFEAASNGRVINNSFVFSSAALSTAVNVGPDTSPSTFTFSSNVWHAFDDPAKSTPSLPVAESGDGALIGRGSFYLMLPDDPYAALSEEAGVSEEDGVCPQFPEYHAAFPFPDIDGTIGGSCRRGSNSNAIGPFRAGNCTLF